MIIKRECRCKHCHKSFIDTESAVFQGSRKELLILLKDQKKDPEETVTIHECDDGLIGLCEITAMVLEE